MGKNKAQLNWNGKLLIDSIAEVLREALGEHKNIVSGNYPQFQSVRDMNLNRGPIEGFRSVLNSISQFENYNKIVVVPVDMPLLTKSLIQQLVLCDSRSDAIKFFNSTFPVAFNNPKKILLALNRLNRDLEQTGNLKNYSFCNLYKNINVNEIHAKQKERLINTNTPEEWANAISKANHIR